MPLFCASAYLLSSIPDGAAISTHYEEKILRKVTYNNFLLLEMHVLYEISTH